MSEPTQVELDAIASQEAQDDDTADSSNEISEQSEESKQFEAQLQIEREARKKAEEASAELAFKLRERKRQVEDDAEDEKPLTASQIQSILAQERETVRKEMQSTEINKLASNFTTDANEKELILEIHKNRTFPAHLSLEEQLEEAYILANKKRLLGENSELKRALKSRQGSYKDSSTTHQDSPTSSPTKLPAKDVQEYVRLGFKWNETSRRYEKKLSNGQILVKLKDGGTQVVKA